MTSISLAKFPVSFKIAWSSRGAREIALVSFLRLDFLFSCEHREIYEKNPRTRILTGNGISGDWNYPYRASGYEVIKFTVTLFLLSENRCESRFPRRLNSQFRNEALLFASFRDICERYSRVAHIGSRCLQHHRFLGALISCTFSSAVWLRFRNTDIEAGLSRNCSRAPIIPVCAIRFTQRREYLVSQGGEAGISFGEEWGAKRR